MTVIIPAKAYKSIVAASVRYANPKIPRDEWLEVSGVLIGRNDSSGGNTNVIISDAYPIMHQELDREAVIDQYKWADEDYLSLLIIDDEAFCRDPPEFTVGWWYSHPGFKIMMSHIDIRTTLSYQQNNPNAISLVFNPERLARQIELADKRGDPDIKLKNDPGFKIFRLDDVARGIQASYHEVDFKIEGFESVDHLMVQIQKFIIDVTMNFPRDNLVESYQNIIEKNINELRSQIQGTEEYLMTLVRKGEKSRIQEVLEKQKKDIRRYVAETYIKLGNLKEFKDYLEYKERETLIPKIDEIIARWDEAASNIDENINQIAKKV